MSSSARSSTRPASLSDRVLAAVALLLVAEAVVMWAGAELAAVFHGTPGALAPSAALAATLSLAAHAGHPGLAWPSSKRALLPGPVPYWAATAGVQVGVIALGAWAWARLGPGRAGGWRLFRKERPGFAPRAEVRANLGEAAVRARAKTVRPSVKAHSACMAEIGIHLGKDVSSGLSLYGSHEDSYLVLGPPRSGKGVSIIIPGVLDTPGAAVVTATRPDTLRATGGLRAKGRPVVVFDPQGISGFTQRLAWSPVHGCEAPEVAILRGSGLAAGAGFQGSTTDADYWTRCAAIVLQCYLHAAALGELTMRDVISWAARPADPTPIAILRGAKGAAEGWAERLSAEAASDPRRRDSVWSGVGRALDCLAHPGVLAACSPPPKAAFDAKDFLDKRGTIYLVGSPGAQLSVAPLITALVEDLAETARRLAAGSPGTRLDPPLSLWLDEAANIAPLPSLPQLLSDGGGTGIATVMVLQSLAQARHRWGEAQADAVWDAATLKVVLPGLAHAEDLSRISRLAGEVDEETLSRSRGPGGETTSTSIRRVPALPLDRLRNLAQGHAIVLHRRTPPIEAVLAPWWERPCAEAVRACLATSGPVP
ncbi:MAG: type IV secretory system conjugative DNA transfer family protein [Acidimicrobiales bacterium]